MLCFKSGDGFLNPYEASRCQGADPDCSGFFHSGRRQAMSSRNTAFWLGFESWTQARSRRILHQTLIEAPSSRDDDCSESPESVFLPAA